MTIPLKQPILSICIPAYNRAAELSLSLKALLPQIAWLREKVELIISDDASPDNTAQIVAAMNTEGLIQYHRNETNIGANPNFSLAVNTLAKGKFIWLLGQDDMVLEGSIEYLVALLEKNNELPYFYINYNTFRITLDENTTLDDCINASVVAERDQNSYRVSQIAEIIPHDVNCFTPMYASIMAKELMSAAIVPAAGKPFSSAGTVVPIALYIAKNMAKSPGYYVGRPCLTSSANITWLQYQPVFHLVYLPGVYDEFEKSGADPHLLEKNRKILISESPGFLVRMLSDSTVPMRSNFRLSKFIWKNAKYKELWPALLITVRTLLVPYHRHPSVVVFKGLWNSVKFLKRIFLSANVKR